MSDSVKKYGDWELGRWCKECNAFLTDDNYFGKQGICIYCGAKCRSVLPEVKERVRRKVYTDAPGRREAIAATKSKNGIFSFLKYQMTRLFSDKGPKERNYTWEYRDGQ